MKALVLAGGLPQVALIEELKQRGIKTVLADYNENPVAKQYADIFYQVSTLDVEAITKVAIKEKVDFLITVCTDQALLTVADVSESLGLPCYVDYQTALNVTNKAYMKKVFVENQISTAKYVIMTEFTDNTLESFKYPLIVKPVDCNSSKGVKKVFSKKEIKEAVGEAVKLSRTGNVVIEEYITGIELSVDVYIEDGKAHILAVSELDKIPENDKFIIFRSKCSTTIEKKLFEQIQKTAQQIAKAFKIKNSPMLIQMITDGERVFVLEFSARTGGGEKFLTIKKICGFDVIKAVVDLTLGIMPHFETSNAESKYCVSEFIYCRPGVFDSLIGFEELKKEGVVSNTMLFKWKGAKFESIENSGDRIAGYIIQGMTKEEIMKKHKKVLDKICVLDSEGNNMMRSDIMEIPIYE